MTAVEFLIDKICGEHTEAWKEEIQQAKEMFEQQIIEAHGIKENHGWENGRSWWNQKTGEQYYNETYKNKT